MRITYLAIAVQDLGEIRASLAANYPSMVQPAGIKLSDRINGLAQFPNLGKSGRVFGTRELVIPQVGKISYIVIYRVKREEIQILRVLAGMRDVYTILDAGFGEEED